MAYTATKIPFIYCIPRKEIAWPQSQFPHSYFSFSPWGGWGGLSSLKQKSDRSVRFKLKNMCEITWGVWGWGWPARLLEDGAGSVDGSAAHLRGVEAACGGRELDMLRALQVSTAQKNKDDLWGGFLILKNYGHWETPSYSLVSSFAFVLFKSMTGKSTNQWCYTVKKVSVFPIPYQTLPGRKEFNISGQGEFG